MARRGVTLLELIAVVTILGFFAIVAVSRIGSGTLDNFGAQADARRLAVDLLQARRRSIATGENHYVNFTIAGGEATGYTLYRRDGGGDVAVDSLHEFPANVVVTSSHDDAEFTFEGMALAAYQIELTGPEQTWRVNVVPVTGAIDVLQTAP
jgi:prepilin-type N-terminal cleavage/methylation domain-containing protein